ncbi:MAG: lysophospholipase [Formosimonas sp.]
MSRTTTWLSCSDSVQLHLTHDATSSSLPPIVLLHGYSEHAGRYAHVVAWLTQHGFSVWTYDARGHGLSQGARGFIPSDGALVDDCVTVFEYVAQMTHRTPIILAHSMGGLTAALAVTTRGIKPHALVLSSPALRVRMTRSQKCLLHLGLRLFPNRPIRSPAVMTEYLTHDVQMVRDYCADPLVHRMISPRLARFMRDGGDAVRAHVKQLSMPTLLLYAGNDQVIDSSGTDDLAAIAPANVTVKRYAQAYHEIFNEAEPLRSEVLHDLINGLTA